MNIRVLVLSCLIVGMAVVGSGCHSREAATSSPTTPKVSGEAVFMNHCMGCHTGGQNNLVPDKPIQGSSKLVSGKIFSEFVREGAGNMPGFSSDVISEQELNALYDYVSKTFEAPIGVPGKHP